jgi:CheY-like chemotaxis protein
VSSSTEARNDEQLRRMLADAGARPDARREVIEALASRTVWLPLRGEAEQPFCEAVVEGGARALAVFTTAEALDVASRKHDLRDALGEVRAGEVGGRLALGHVVRGALHGAVIDLGARHSLLLRREEIEPAIARVTSNRRASSAVSAVPASAQQVRIVVVDDDATILQMLKRFLTSRGADVAASASPFGVGNIVVRHKPTVLVLDVAIPALDGEQLWALLASSAMPRTSVVFYSALTLEALAALTARVPESESVSKSAGLNALWEAIQRAHRRSVLAR